MIRLELAFIACIGNLVPTCRYTLRRCGPQGAHVLAGPQSRVHVDPHWASVFGGDPRGSGDSQRPNQALPMFVVHIDTKQDGPLVSSTRVFSCGSEAQLRELKLLLADEAALNAPSANAGGGLIRALRDVEHRAELDGIPTYSARSLFDPAAVGAPTLTYAPISAPISDVPHEATPEGGMTAAGQPYQAAAPAASPAPAGGGPQGAVTVGSGPLPHSATADVTSPVGSTPPAAVDQGQPQGQVEAESDAEGASGSGTGRGQGRQQAGEVELGRVGASSTPSPEESALPAASPSSGPVGSTAGQQDNSDASGQQVSGEGGPGNTTPPAQQDDSPWLAAWPTLASPLLAALQPAPLPFAGIVLQPSLDEVWLAQPDGYLQRQAELAAAVASVIEAARQAGMSHNSNTAPPVRTTVGRAPAPAPSMSRVVPSHPRPAAAVAPVPLIPPLLPNTYPPPPSHAVPCGQPSATCKPNAARGSFGVTCCGRCEPISCCC